MPNLPVWIRIINSTRHTHTLVFKRRGSPAENKHAPRARSVLPVKDLDVVPIYGVMGFSAVFFNCRWNATWGRRFVFLTSFTQLSASLSFLSGSTLLATKFKYTSRAFVNGNEVLGSNKKLPEGGVCPKGGSNTIRLEHSLHPPVCRWLSQKLQRVFKSYFLFVPRNRVILVQKHTKLNLYMLHEILSKPFI